MAAAAIPSTPAASITAKHNIPHRHRLIGRRRRVDDEGIEDDGSNDAADLADDDSLTEESVGSDERTAAHNSDTSNIDEASPAGPVVSKGSSEGGQRDTEDSPAADPEAQKGAGVSNGTAIVVSGSSGAANLKPNTSTGADASAATAPTVPKPTQPTIVSSSSMQAPRKETAYEKQRREHDLYKQKRDQDPAFVPNRGAFFMHDHRGAGPAANGFRPFGRAGRGGGRGRGGFVGAFSPMHGPFHGQADPSTNGPWAHDMHEVVAQPIPSRLPPTRRQNYDTRSQYGGSQFAGSVRSATIPTCPPSAVAINRSMSTEKQLGTVTLRVFFPPMKEPVLFEKFKVTQYTKLPDHRPPLRRDKAVVISLPGYRRRQIFPAVDRSFIFIPRALRPNQQRMHGNRTHSVMGSVSGFSRRTSVLGAGSYYNGSTYSPSVALSRRSSIAQDAGRDFLMSPTGSAVSRPAMAVDGTARPVVRLPPTAMPHGQFGPVANGPGIPGAGPVLGFHGGPNSGRMPPQSIPHPQFVLGPGAPTPRHYQPPPPASSQPPPPQQPPSSENASSLSTVPPPQHHPLPQKPTFQENRQIHNLPMHQPRPQKTVSVGNIEKPSSDSPAQPPANQQPHPMPFHQQVPIQMPSGYPTGDFHSRDSSYNPRSTGTPLSQIPERAIHAAPFQPNQPAQPILYAPPPTHVPAVPGYYGPANGYPMLQHPSQQGYLYQGPPPYASSMPASAAAPAFVSGAPHSIYRQPGQGETPGTPGQHGPVAQEVNGMVYYLDPTQVPNVPSYPAFVGPAPPQGGYMAGPGGIVSPTPDGYYYGPVPGMVYYPQ